MIIHVTMFAEERMLNLLVMLEIVKVITLILKVVILRCLKIPNICLYQVVMEIIQEAGTSGLDSLYARCLFKRSFFLAAAKHKYFYSSYHPQYKYWSP